MNTFRFTTLVVSESLMVPFGSASAATKLSPPPPSTEHAHA